MAYTEENTPHATVVAGRDPVALRRRRRAVWLHFPRRAVLLIAAYAIAIFILRTLPIAAEPLADPTPGGPAPIISAAVLERLPSSLALLASTLIVAFVLSLVVAIVAVLVAWLQARSPRIGGVLRALGRMALYIWMPLPFIIVAFLLILLLFAGPLTVLGPLFSPTGNNVSTLLLGALVLAFYPALLAAHDAAEVAAGPDPRQRYPRRPGRRLLAAFLRLGESLLVQTAGIFSALAVVELIFARPGLGALLVQSIFQRDLPTALSALSVMAVMVLLGRLSAELLSWVGLFIAGSEAIDIAPAAKARPEHRLWTVFGVLLLLLPLALVAMGLLTSPEAAAQQDLQQRLAAPSPEHPVGTDALGRDIWARVRLGSLNTLASASLIAGALLLPALILGLLSGALFNRGGWLWQSLADLLLLPVDALLFFPLIPAAATVAALFGQVTTLSAVLALAVLFLPRTARAVRDMWRARREGNGLRDVLSSLAALFLLALFNAFVVLLALEYLGFGPLPPTPSLGQMLQESQQHLRVAPAATSALLVVIGITAFALFTSAAGVSGFVDSRRPLVDMNE